MSEFIGHPNSYDSENHSYYSLSNVGNGYTDSSSGSYATIYLTRGSNAETYIWFLFDTSNIPDKANIVSVSCTIKCYIITTTSSIVTTRQAQLFAGDVAKGNPTTLSNRTSVLTMDVGNWTLDELRNIKLKVHGVRGTSNTTTNYYFRFYGATLTVEYEEYVPNTIFAKVGNNWLESQNVFANVDGAWGVVQRVYKKEDNVWVEQNDISAMFNNNVTYNKPYDAEVEYLESTGTQYIDTGIVPDADTGIHIKVSCSNTNDTYIIGLRDTSGNTRWCIGHSNTSKFYYGYATWATGGNTFSDMDAICNMNYLNSGKFDVIDFYDETHLSVNLPTLGFTPERNIRLFGADYYTTSAVSSFSGKIYEVTITQGNNIIMSLIPVRRGRVGYMYDKITGNIYGNAGSGSFTFGNDKT